MIEIYDDKNGLKKTKKIKYNIKKMDNNTITDVNNNDMSLYYNILIISGLLLLYYKS